MAVEFLTDEQAAGYGDFDDPMPLSVLERYFYLDDADRELVGKRRGRHNKLGFAVQLGTVRCVGTFLSDPAAVPTSVLNFVAEQLGIEDPSCIKRYAERESTAWEHTAEIRKVFDYRTFSGESERLRDFLAARAWIRVETAKALFDTAVDWMREHRVLLPGLHTVLKLVMDVRSAAAKLVGTAITAAAGAVDPALPSRLLQLLNVPEGERISDLERLRRGPTRVSGREMNAALSRASELAALGAGAVDLSGVPMNRVEALARDGLASKAPVLRNRTEPRRTATLVAAVRSLSASAVDDALDLFGVLMATRLVRVAQRASQKIKAADLPKLARAGHTLATAVAVLLAAMDDADEDAVDVGSKAPLDVASVMAAIEQVASRDRLAAAVATVEMLAPADEDDDGAWREELVKRFGVVLQRELIVANTRDGLAAARARGRKGGRPSKLTGEQVEHAQRLYDGGEHTVAEIADLLGVRRTTLYGHLSKAATATAAPDTTHPAAARAEEPEQPAPPRRTARACPSCGHEPTTRADAAHQRADLAVTWLYLDPEATGEIIARNHCRSCQRACRRHRLHRLRRRPHPRRRTRRRRRQHRRPARACPTMAHRRRVANESEAALP